MKDISIGSWAYTIGPYEDEPVSWEEVITTLAGLGFQGVELGGFPPHPNPDDMPSTVRFVVLPSHTLREVILLSHFVGVVIRFAHVRIPSPPLSWLCWNR